VPFGVAPTGTCRPGGPGGRWVPNCLKSRPGRNSALAAPRGAWIVNSAAGVVWIDYTLRVRWPAASSQTRVRFACPLMLLIPRLSEKTRSIESHRGGGPSASAQGIWWLEG